ncbi:MAG TPA: OmpA family protein, partial [Thermoanaerobaculia bacterium]|nr:OmpA family protein [Thermoanaerobaculia bacterium]
TIPGLFYRSGRSQISWGSQGVLQRIAEQLAANPDVRVAIEGHTDSSGGEDKNLQLSQARADGLKDLLVTAGIDPSRITSIGRGEMVPISDDLNAEGRARNRRIELILGF